MSEEIFEIYEFIRDNDLEIHCYDYERIDRQIIVFISPLWIKEFMELLVEQVPGSLDEGGYEARITSSGDLGIDLMDIIKEHCSDDESDKWFARFKKYSSECC